MPGQGAASVETSLMTWEVISSSWSKVPLTFDSRSTAPPSSGPGTLRPVEPVGRGGQADPLDRVALPEARVPHAERVAVLDDRGRRDTEAVEGVGRSRPRGRCRRWPGRAHESRRRRRPTPRSRSAGRPCRRCPRTTCGSRCCRSRCPGTGPPSVATSDEDGWGCRSGGCRRSSHLRRMPPGTVRTPRLPPRARRCRARAPSPGGGHRRRGGRAGRTGPAAGGQRHECS